MIITIHPEMTIDLQINMKQPGAPWESKPVRLNFDHFNTFKVNTPEAYQQILEKVLLSDKSLFPSMQEIMESWKIVSPMLRSTEIEQYEDKTLPSCAVSLIEEDGRTWFE